jgi:hypothetical protein
MSGRRLLIVPLALACVGFSVIRDPATLNPIGWASSSVTVRIQQDGAAGITDGSDILAIRAALATWMLPTCAAFAFVDGGLTPTGGAANDGTNRISFTQSWSGPVGVVALTEQIIDTGVSPQQYIDADITANETDFAWATDGDLHAYDVASVMTHELGHVVGLAHSPVLESTMYFGSRVSLTLNRTLHADDERGVCYLYPAATFACATDADCPFFFGGYHGGADVRSRCAAPNCVTGAAADGSACAVNGDCTGGKCLRGLDSAPAFEPGICTRSCTLSPNNCPSGALCHADTTGAGLGNVCFAGYVDCTSDDECFGGPAANWYCVRDLDGRYRCLRTCLNQGHCAIVPGTVCHGGTGAEPPGFCRVPGAGTDGAACQDGYGCESLYCSGTSTQPVCGRNATPVDSGPAADGLASSDSGPAPDGGPGADDRGADSSGGDRLMYTDADAPILEDGGILVGGCACAELRGSKGRAESPFGGAVAIGGLVTLPLMLRRRRRRASRTHGVD